MPSAVTKSAVAKTASKTGFLNVFAGGSGALAAGPVRELWLAGNRQVAIYAVLLDTDKPGQANPFDAYIPLGLTHDQIRLVKSTPASFGPTVERIVAEVACLLNEEDFRNGARTTRPLAELAFHVHREALAAHLNQCLRDQLHLWGCDAIIPFLISSTGGGTGSALTILLAAALKDPHFRSRVLQGLPDGLLGDPIAVVIEPFYRAFSHARDPIHTSKILGNAMAFRIESAYLELRGCFKNIFHLGLSNPGGTVLDSERDVARVLGTSIFQYQKHWETHIKPRTVDTADIHALFGHYSGHDVPENILKRSSFAAPPTTDSNGAHSNGANTANNPSTP